MHNANSVQDTYHEEAASTVLYCLKKKKKKWQEGKTVQVLWGYKRTSQITNVCEIFINFTMHYYFLNLKQQKVEMILKQHAQFTC